MVCAGKTQRRRVVKAIIAAITALFAKPKKSPVDRFPLCVSRIFKQEGGYVNHPSDPGGATNMGITIGTLSDWRGHAVTPEDVRNLTREEAGDIYRAGYWDPVKGSELPVGVDLVVFDFGVNAGPSRAIKMLQRVVGASNDGIIGPETLRLVRIRDATGVVIAYGEARLDYYRSLRHFDTFGKGWTARTEHIQKQALSDIGW